jgi:UDP-3-O-[3-hydroxymyristoyl] glucosamine N-acyltransferase
MILNKPLIASEIAKRFDAILIGKPDNNITSINEIHKVREGSITFVDHLKYYQKVLDSEATIIIINKKADCPEGKTLLVVKNPFEVYNQLALEARPFIPATASVSETAIIGENTVIQPNVFIGNHVKIGKNCVIHANVSIYDYTEIEDNVIIHSNTSLGADAFYYHGNMGAYDKMHTIGKVIIKDDVEIGPGCTIVSGVSGHTQIGKGTKIDSQVHIGHGTVVGSNCLFAAQVAIAGKTYIGDNVILYGKVGVSKDVMIGKNAIVLASSNIDKTIEGNKTYFGSPAIDARDKWKEMVYVRMLPKVWHKILFKADPKSNGHKVNDDELLA